MYRWNAGIAHATMLVCVVSIIVTVGWGAVADAQTTQNQAEAGTASIEPKKVPVELLPQVPQLSEDQIRVMQEQSLRRSHLTTPALRETTNGLRNALPLVPQTPVPTPPKTTGGGQTNQTVPHDPPQAPGDYAVFRDTRFGPPSSPLATSDISEPAVGTNGPVVFYSANWYAALSKDLGQTFNFISPYTQFPSIDGGFCCDQDVMFHPSQDLFIWTLQYISTATKNTIRIAVATGGTLLTNGASGFCYYDFNPQQMGFASGLWFDYPRLSISENFVWYATNVFNQSDVYQSTVIWRMPLQNLSTCSSLTFNYFSQAGSTMTTVENAQTTMFFARHLSTTQMRIFRWAEASGTIFWDDVTVTAWPNAARSCPGPDGLNWCGRSDSRIMTGWLAQGVIGFMWNASQGTGGFGTFAYPYVHVARFNASTRALINEPILWSSGNAYIYPGIAVNSRGHLGGTVYYGGGSLYPTMATFIWDDLTVAPPPWTLFGVVASDSGTSNRWGDYYRARRFGHPSSNTTWVVGGQYRTSGSVRSVYLWFGRERDRTFACNVMYRGQDTSGDTRTDLPLRNNTGAVGTWLLTGTGVSGAAVFGDLSGWRLVGVGDLNGDGRGDYVWRDFTSGTVAVWFMNGTSVGASATIGTAPGVWHIIGVADVNGDGRADILWRNDSGTVAVWFMNGSTVNSSGVIGSATSDWRIIAVGDFNGDGRTDLWWRHNNGSVAVWLLNGASVVGTNGFGAIDLAWHVVAVGDVNGDGRQDLVWRHDNGSLAVWFLNGIAAPAGASVGLVGLDWHVAFAGDVTADGRADILWRHDSGTLAGWFMNGATITGALVYGNLPGYWHISGGEHDPIYSLPGQCRG